MREDNPVAGDGTSTTGSACCRPASARPCAPFTPWPGASTTSATGPAPPAALAGAAAALQEVRTSLELLAKAAGEGTPAAAAPPGDPVLTALADTARQFPVPIDAFLDLVEGCEWDLAGRRYHSFAELVEYCRRVAGTIGRLSLAVYGSSDGPQPSLWPTPWA